MSATSTDPHPTEHNPQSAAPDCWQDEHTLQAALTPWVAQRLSRAPHELRLGPWQRSDGGYSNVTLLGELQAPGLSPVPLVLRIESQAPSVFPDTDVQRQYRIMQALQGSEVPVPELMGLESTLAPLGAPFYLMKRVPGRVPNENPQYHVSGWFHDLEPAQQRSCWMAGLDTLGAIARLDWRARGLHFLLPPQGLTPLQAQLAFYERALSWAESLARPYPHLRQGLQWLKAHQPGQTPVALSWGDAKLGNCVFDGTRLAAALDWEQATLAHPVDDLAWWLMVDESLSSGYGAPRLAGLPSREESIACWEAAAGQPARDLAYYEVFAAWRMAYVMARIGTIFTQRGWVPTELRMDVNNGGATLLARHATRLGFASGSTQEGSSP